MRLKTKNLVLPAVSPAITKGWRRIKTVFGHELAPVTVAFLITALLIGSMIVTHTLEITTK